ncbi:MAG TPA: rhomboid family intramembrane serine protease [Thermoanaerobaculia bacterium]|jgi:rhomboid protease GluP|nr:rhomboid family intramembrane serine protease [Thermoanaerobaculia bacterium]
MLGRRRTGSVVCPGCGKLVGAGESRCPFCGRPAPAMFGLTAALRRLGLRLGLWPLIGWACGALYLATVVTSGGGVGGGGVLGLFAPSFERLFAFGASGPVPVLQYGRWWTVLSAGWLHGNLLHIGLNLYALWQIAPAVEHLYGTGRALVIYTLSSVLGFLASSLSPFMPSPLRLLMGAGGGITVGASAALFGLLGALIHYSRRGGSRALGQQIWLWVIFMFVFGRLSPGVDNWAHLGGFLGGWLLAFWLDPLRPERLDHLVAGLLCLLASAGAIVWSLVSFQRLAG